MTRVLQLRRGTTVQNNNFTGLPGEITVDTDVNTVRIHDGQTLGGYPLARADEVSNNFDINSVPNTFWENLFAQYAPNATSGLYIGESVAIDSETYIEQIFETTRTPIMVQIALCCQNSDAGYAVGDSVFAFGIGIRTAPTPIAFSDSTGLHLRLMIGGEGFWVSHKNTGQTTIINNENWRVQFRLYC